MIYAVLFRLFWGHPVIVLLSVPVFIALVAFTSKYFLSINDSFGDYLFIAAGGVCIYLVLQQYDNLSFLDIRNQLDMLSSFENPPLYFAYLLDFAFIIRGIWHCSQRVLAWKNVALSVVLNFIFGFFLAFILLFVTDFVLYVTSGLMVAGFVILFLILLVLSNLI